MKQNKYIMLYRQLKQGQDKRASKKVLQLGNTFFEVLFESHQMMTFQRKQKTVPFIF